MAEPHSPGVLANLPVEPPAKAGAAQWDRRRLRYATWGMGVLVCGLKSLGTRQSSTVESTHTSFRSARSGLHPSSSVSQPPGCVTEPARAPVSLALEWA